MTKKNFPQPFHFYETELQWNQIYLLLLCECNFLFFTTGLVTMLTELCFNIFKFLSFKCFFLQKIYFISAMNLRMKKMRTFRYYTDILYVKYYIYSPKQIAIQRQNSFIFYQVFSENFMCTFNVGFLWKLVLLECIIGWKTMEISRLSAIHTFSFKTIMITLFIHNFRHMAHKSTVFLLLLLK